MKMKIYIYVFVVSILFCIAYIFSIKQSSSFNKRIAEYALSDNVNRTFNGLMQGVSRDPYYDWDFYKNFSQEAVLKAFPRKIIDTVKRMNDNDLPQAIILHNVPIDHIVPATPRDGLRPTDKGFISESILLGFCSLLDCEPILASPNSNIVSKNPNLKNQGSYIHQIIPLDDEQSKLTQSSSGSATSFDPHTEAVQYEHPIKFFLLYCLRGDPKVPTSLIFLDDLLLFIKNNFNLSTCTSYEKFLDELKKPQFIMRDSTDIKTASFETILPILMEENGKRIFRFDSNGVKIEGIDEHAQSIVDYLKRVLNDEDFKPKCVKKFYLKEGDLLIFNNLEILHARDSFTIDIKNWRWLQRVYCR